MNVGLFRLRLGHIFLPMEVNMNFFDVIEKAIFKTNAAFGDKSFPDAAFIVERGAEKDDQGKTLQKFRHLPHHKKTAKDPNENSSVDIPHLRNALARVNQVKSIKEPKSQFIKRARAHLERHAKALLKTRQEKTKSYEFKEIIDLIKQFKMKED